MKNRAIATSLIVSCLATLALTHRAAGQEGGDRQCVLELDVPEDASVILDGREHGTRRKFTWDSLQPGKTYVAQIRIRFADGGEAQRMAPISAGRKLTVACHAPSRIVFAGTDPAPGLYSIDPAGTRLRRLTDGNDHAPALSPDGARIAFTRQGKAGHHLWLVNVDGTGLRQLTRGELHYRQPSWSPDGSQIVCTTWFPDDSRRGVTGLTVMNADGTQARLVLDAYGDPRRKLGVIDMRPAWSPDGERVAYVEWLLGWEGEPEMYTISSDGRNRQRVGVYQCPAWSPDGTKLACVRDRGLIVLDLRRNVMTQLVRPRANADEVGLESCWSPDGSALVYSLMETAANLDDTTSALYIVNANGTGNRVLLRQPRSFFSKPDWK